MSILHQMYVLIVKEIGGHTGTFAVCNALLFFIFFCKLLVSVNIYSVYGTVFTQQKPIQSLYLFTLPIAFA